MKKFGFTLSEVIIALAVVGVLSAIAAPMLGSLMPDKNKAIVLKTHKTITDITKDLLDDPRYYSDYTDDNDKKYIGLADTRITQYMKDNGIISVVALNKYPKLFAQKLETNKISKQTYNTVEFETVDGFFWGVQTIDKSCENYECKKKAVILLDINGSSVAPNKLFSGDNKKVDIFRFEVDTYGNVTAGDALTAAYLENPDKLNDKKKDYARAKELLSKY